MATRLLHACAALLLLLKLAPRRAECVPHYMPCGADPGPASVAKANARGQEAPSRTMMFPGSTIMGQTVGGHGGSLRVAFARGQFVPGDSVAVSITGVPTGSFYAVSGQQFTGRCHRGTWRCYPQPHTLTQVQC